MELPWWAVSEQGSEVSKKDRDYIFISEMKLRTGRDLSIGGPFNVAPDNTHAGSVSKRSVPSDGKLQGHFPSVQHRLEWS